KSFVEAGQEQHQIVVAPCQKVECSSGDIWPGRLEEIVQADDSAPREELGAVLNVVHDVGITMGAIDVDETEGRRLLDLGETGQLEGIGLDRFDLRMELRDGRDRGCDFDIQEDEALVTLGR